jgi:hypothetical protein
MPSPYQTLSLKAVLAMFWEPQRVALPEQCVIKSAAALSRFLNEYGWPTRAVIQATRKQIIKELLKYAPRGKRPHLQVIIDLTTLEKRGKFKAFNWLILVSVVLSFSMGSRNFDIKRLWASLKTV